MVSVVRKIKLWARLLPDWYLFNLLISSCLYYKTHRRIPRILNPRTFNEVLLQNKLTSNNLLKAFVTDKEFAKVYLEGLLGFDYCPSTIHIAYSADDSFFDSEVPRSVIKPTHLSGEVVFVVESRLLEEHEKEKIRSWFEHNLFYRTRERNYKYLQPKVIIETMLSENDTPPIDYKIFCFFGKPAFIQVDVERFGTHTRSFYDTLWRKQLFSMLYTIFPGDINKPAGFKHMLDLAQTVSAPFDFVRVDFYENQERLFIGELSFWPENCMGVFSPKTKDQSLFELIRPPGKRPTIMP